MADQQELSSRAIMGMYYRLLEQDPGVEWVNGISNMFASDQASETYKFLGQAPVLREWIAGRQAKSLVAQGVTLTNVHYEATLEIRKTDARRGDYVDIESVDASGYTVTAMVGTWTRKP